MPQSFFIWKGIDCRAMGCRLKGPAAIVRPEERVRHVEIPGRPGDLTEIEGEDIYNSYIQTVTLMVHSGMRVRQIYSWLRGSGYVTFSGEPDRKQAARIIGAVTLNKQSHNLDWWEGEVQFYCAPFKQLLTESQVTVTSSGATVRNNGDVAARPKITVNASAAGSDIKFSVGGQAFEVNMTGMADTGCVIDCDAEMVTNYSGAVDLTHLSSGEFPVLAAGNNTITLTSGVSSLVIDRRERYL